eukprot:m.257702 g.257702  ORF g.257702 m.257702 type:complete len:516 (+) comp15960_c0_seq4:111-1658(+)
MGCRGSKATPVINGAEASQTGGGQPGLDTDVGDTGRTYLEHVDSTPDAPSEQMFMSMSDSSGNSGLELAQVDVKLANDPARHSLERRGVSVHHLITEFKDAVVEAGIDIFNDSSSLVYDVVNQVVKPKTAKVTCPRDGREGATYVDCLEGADNVGEATYMLSYSWLYPITVILGALKHYCHDHKLDPKRTYVWICFVCVNQHRVTEALDSSQPVSFQTLENLFTDKVVKVDRVLALMFPWAEPIYLQRAWCVFEMYVGACMLESTPESHADFLVATKTGRQVKVETIMAPICQGQFMDALEESETEFNKLWNLTQTVCARKADATVPADLHMIRRKIEDGPTFDGLNNKVRSKLAVGCIDGAMAHCERLLQGASIDNRVHRWWALLLFPERDVMVTLANGDPLGYENPITAAEVNQFFDDLEREGPGAAEALKKELQSAAPRAGQPRAALLRAGITTCNLLVRNAQHGEALSLAKRIEAAFESDGGVQSDLLNTPTGLEFRQLLKSLEYTCAAPV